MPLPKPRKGETKEAFVRRFMKAAGDEFDGKQRYAVAMSLWRDKDRRG